jgi:hypothetical protein
VSTPLFLLLLLGLGHAAPSQMAVMMAGPTCPDAAVAGQIEAGFAKHRIGLANHSRVASALARVRAQRALDTARQLYTRTDFPGCISLLSITEQELGRNLPDANPTLQERAHHLLAKVNLWLGICQWAAGDPQTAAASFVRSAQLPSRPAPDPKLLPPELIEAHRAAVEAPRQEVTCDIESPLSSEEVQVDGRRPTLAGDKFRVAAGTHYLILSVPCEKPCSGLGQRVGPEGMRSLRLEASSLRCRVSFPAVPARSRLTCTSLGEAKDPSLVAALIHEIPTGGMVVVSVARGSLGLRVLVAGASIFNRQLVLHLEPLETPSQAVARSIHLLLARDPPPEEKPPRPWYKTWWVWALAGAAVAATTATAIAATRSSTVKEVRMVFGP